MVTPRGRAAESRLACSSLALLFLVFAAFSTAACDKVALTAPTNTTITVFANATSVPLNGVIEVGASVIEPAGTPVQNGTVVTFTANMGILDPREARTHDGKVSARFAAGGISGTAKIGAFSGSAKATEIELKVGGSVANRILVNSNPSNVPSTGGTVEILATVLDENGNRVPGLPVSFSTNAGSLSASSVTTDGNGEARTRLTTNREATVTATAGAAQPGTTTVRVNTTPTVTLTANPQSPVAGQTVQFTISTAATTNGSAIRDVVIDFGDRDTLSLGALTGSTTIAHVYADPGTYTVTVTVTDVTGERTNATTVIFVQPPTPITVTINLQDSGTVNTPVSFRATVTGDTTPSRILRYDWEFGDGTSASVNSPAISHIYTTAGPKTIRLTVVTTNGERLFAQEEISITP